MEPGCREQLHSPPGQRGSNCQRAQKGVGLGGRAPPFTCPRKTGAATLAAASAATAAAAPTVCAVLAHRAGHPIVPGLLRRLPRELPHLQQHSNTSTLRGSACTLRTAPGKAGVLRHGQGGQAAAQRGGEAAAACLAGAGQELEVVGGPRVKAGGAGVVWDLEDAVLGGGLPLEGDGGIGRAQEDGALGGHDPVDRPQLVAVVRPCAARGESSRACEQTRVGAGAGAAEVGVFAAAPPAARLDWLQLLLHGPRHSLSPTSAIVKRQPCQTSRQPPNQPPNKGGRGQEHAGG